MSNDTTPQRFLFGPDGSLSEVPEGGEGTSASKDDGSLATESHISADATAEMVSHNDDGSTTTTELHSDGTFEATTVDEFGRGVDRTKSFVDGNVAHATIEYDADGNQVLHRRDSNGFTSEQFAHFDDAGHLVVTTTSGTPDGGHLIQQAVTDFVSGTTEVTTIGQDTVTGAPLVSHQTLSSADPMPSPQVPDDIVLAGGEPLLEPHELGSLEPSISAEVAQETFSALDDLNPF